MTTPAQIAANRRNARRSTGPKTRQGKKTSSQNARRHGLLGQVVTLPDEDPASFTAFHERMTTELVPLGPLEEFLVERIIAAAWRLGRVVRLETGVLAVRTAEAETALTTTDRNADPVAVGVIRDTAGADTLATLRRYERSFERSLYRALHELERRQARRRGADVAVPGIVDVEVTTDDP